VRLLRARRCYVLLSFASRATILGDFEPVSIHREVPGGDGGAFNSQTGVGLGPYKHEK
jgi:hypothetical protein